MPHRLTAFLLCLLLVPSLAWGAVKAKKNVLYINSYQNGYTWSDDILRGLREKFESGPFQIDLQIEYLDSKKYPGEALKGMFLNFFKYKFKDTKFDIIVVSDNYAFDFIREYKKDLFPNLPVVFCGVNDFHDEMLAGHPDFTGVLENPDFEENFELALRYHPGRKKMIVIGDRSLTGMAIQNQVRDAAKGYANRLDFEYWDSLSLNEILDRVKRIPDDALVFLIPFYKDSFRQFYSVDEVLSAVYKNTNVPIYSAWEFMLGYGIVGGRLHSGVTEGRLTAEMALRILSGTPVADIPIIRNTYDQYVFDYNVLKKLGIPMKLLPDGSKIINEPKRFYEINIQVFWTIIICLILLIVVLISLISNMNRRRVVEERIKDQLSFLEILMDTIPIPLYFKNADGRFGGCNQAFEKWFGVSGRELTDDKERKTAMLRIDPLLEEADGRVLSSSGAEVIETDLGSDGTRHRVILHKAAYRSAKGETAGLVGTIYDITGLKKAEDELRQSRQMLRLVIDTIPMLVYWKDKSLRYLGVNLAFMDFFGVDDAEAVIGKTEAELAPMSQYAGMTDELDMQVMGTGRPRLRVEVSVRNADGQPIILELGKVPLYDDSGRVVGILSTAEDVTQRVNLEKQLLQSQKMEAIGTLAGGIAHDFNNILTSIINSAELALLDIDAESATAEDMERVLKAARRGGRLVGQILTFSRPSRAGFQTVDVAEVVREAFAFLKASLPRNIRTREDIRVSPAWCMADPTQLHQIVMNLCTNSFQALRDLGGEIDLTLEGTEIEAEEAGQLNVEAGPYLRLTIADDGPGISQDILDKIFEPFFTTKDKTEGTGLGLAVVHGIVKGHKGAILATSSPGRRTEFSIFLPRSPGMDSLDRAGEQEAPGGHERILFVEDDEDQLLTVPRVLGQLGYAVTARQIPDAALADVSADPAGFDLVITDFDMPETNGFELARRIAEVAPSLPVLMVSGRERAVMTAPRTPNIRNILLKPYDRKSLAEAVRAILDAAKPGPDASGPNPTE